MTVKKIKIGKLKLNTPRYIQHLIKKTQRLINKKRIKKFIIEKSVLNFILEVF